VLGISTGGKCVGTDYRRFATAGEAIRYAVEELSTRRSLSAWMQVGEDRLNMEEINRLTDEMISFARASE
jgi:Arc/MetJ-type ribon-helix-helix transcriptional regulator